MIGVINEGYYDDNDTILFAAIMFIILVYIYQSQCKNAENFEIEGTVRVKSQIDGAYYKVHSKHTNPQLAADTLAKLHGMSVSLLRHLRKKYITQQNNPEYQKHPRVIAVKKILARYNPDNIVESSPYNPENDTSFTIDKGAILAVCVRSATTGELHDINTLTFVTLHELTHIAIEEQDHPPIFWRTFKFILSEAAEIGLYNPVDYAKNPVHYCRMFIEDNPLLEPSIQSI